MTQTKKSADTGLTVAVTGPTGEVGRSVLAALERSDRVKRVLGMARRPFDPAAHGWKKVEYRRGDVMDRSTVDDLVAEADVVVHLAWIIFGDRDETRKVNLEGSRNVFEATVKAGPRRLVYTSSIAAYGFHEDNPELLTEDLAPRGTEEFYYSAEKAELESLFHEVMDGSDIDQYILRPCIVGGRDAPALINDVVRRFQLGGRWPLERDLLRVIPGASPVLPEAGTSFQLVHHDDCADAIVAAIEGRGTPGIYNLAGDGAITMTDVAGELGWRTVPMPGLAVKAAVAVGVAARAPAAAGPRVGQRRTPILDHGHHQGAPRTRLAPAPRGGGCHARDDRRSQGRGDRLVTSVIVDAVSLNSVLAADARLTPMTPEAANTTQARRRRARDTRRSRGAAQGDPLPRPHRRCRCGCGEHAAVEFLQLFQGPQRAGHATRRSDRGRDVHRHAILA